MALRVNLANFRFHPYQRFSSKLAQDAKKFANPESGRIPCDGYYCMCPTKDSIIAPAEPGQHLHYPHPHHLTETLDDAASSRAISPLFDNAHDQQQSYLCGKVPWEIREKIYLYMLEDSKRCCALVPYKSASPDTAAGYHLRGLEQHQDENATAGIKTCRIAQCPTRPQFLQTARTCKRAYVDVMSVFLSTIQPTAVGTEMLYGLPPWMTTTGLTPVTGLTKLTYMLDLPLSALEKSNCSDCLRSINDQCVALSRMSNIRQLEIKIFPPEAYRRAATGNNSIAKKKWAKARFHWLWRLLTMEGEHKITIKVPIPRCWIKGQRSDGDLVEKLGYATVDRKVEFASEK